MPHIPLPEDLPGMTGLLAYKPATGVRIAELMHELLRGASPLSAVERETIGAYVSQLNGCDFCARTHGAAAQHLKGTVEESGRMAALLRLAGAVASGGKAVTGEEVAAARDAGATDEEIHDAVLVAAAFCMVNRYVDGLATTDVPDEALDEVGARLAAVGYRRI